jgi:quercetin dioxygenase-like cupin family protein
MAHLSVKAADSDSGIRESDIDKFYINCIIVVSGQEVIMNSFRYVVSLLSLMLFIAIINPILVRAEDSMGDQVFVNSGEIKWGDAPPTLPKGAKVAVLYGDPGKSGPFVIRLMAPAGYKIPPHWHTQAENLTVVSGTLYLERGDKPATNLSHALNAGGYHYLPAKAHHSAFTKVRTIVQIHGEGPFDINYINPKDDPQNIAKK